MNKEQASAKVAVARALFDAFIYGRREVAEVLIASDFKFTSPYDDGIDRATYFTRCWPNGDRFVDFRIERVAADPDGAFVTYHCTLDDGSSFRNTEYVRIKDGKVAAVDVYFGATYRDGKFVTQDDAAKDRATDD